MSAATLQNTNKSSTYWRKNWLFWLVNLGAAIPLLHLGWDWWQGNLSVNPIDDLTDRTGTAALVLLILCLTCTPLITITGWRQPATVRKSLGLWAFVYATFHLLNFVGLDYGFNLNFILMDGLPSKPFIIMGLIAFLILLALALTSTQGWQRRLGKNWKRLHKLVYVAGVAVIIHFFWLAKAADDWEPALYGMLLALLLVLRIPAVRQRIVKWRQASAPASTQNAAAKPRTTGGVSAKNPAVSKPIDDLSAPAD